MSTVTLGRRAEIPVEGKGVGGVGQETEQKRRKVMREGHGQEG
jgi:hypothetical protein